MMWNKKKLLVTHDGSFHADDVFATAVLSILNKGRVKIVRTRDEKIIAKGDYVYDVGSVYDPEKNRFDHHQVGGAGKRENGIEYSSFGLVWKKFGEQICGSKKVAEIIDNKLVVPVDAGDNGFDLVEKKYNVFPYLLEDVLSIFKPTTLETMNIDDQFFKALTWAEEILKREIKKTNDQIEIAKIIQNFYQNSQDKRLVIIDAPKVSRYEIWDALQNFPKLLFAVYGDVDGWRVVGMRKDVDTFENKKNLPAAWSGLQDEEFQKISGVTDATFCHRGLFLAGAKSKEGAIKLAELAL